MEDSDKEVCLILCSKNPFPSTSSECFDFPHYIITWLLGNKHHYGTPVEGRKIHPYEGNSVTNYIAYLMGLSHGEVLDIIARLKQEKLL